MIHYVQRCCIIPCQHRICSFESLGMKKTRADHGVSTTRGRRTHRASERMYCHAYTYICFKCWLAVPANLEDDYVTLFDGTMNANYIVPSMGKRADYFQARNSYRPETSYAYFLRVGYRTAVHTSSPVPTCGDRCNPILQRKQCTVVDLDMQKTPSATRGQKKTTRGMVHEEDPLCVAESARSSPVSKTRHILMLFFVPRIFDLLSIFQHSTYIKLDCYSPTSQSFRGTGAVRQEAS